MTSVYTLGKWIDLAHDKGLLLLYSTVKSLPVGESLVLAAALEQGARRSDLVEGKVYTAEEYWLGNKEVYTNMGDYVVLNGEEFDPDVFFPIGYDAKDVDDTTFAGLGTGSDSSILWSKLAYMPSIYNVEEDESDGDDYDGEGDDE